MVLRQGSSRDLGELIEVYRSGYEGMEEYAYTSSRRIREYIKWLLRGDKEGFFVVEEEGGKPVGFACIHTGWWDRVESQTGELHEIVVRREYQGKGLGKMLLQKCLEYAREKGRDRVTLWVGERNMVARNWYKREGFEEIGRAGVWVRMRKIIR